MRPRVRPLYALAAVAAAALALPARALAPPPPSEPTYPALPGAVRGTVRVIGAPPLNWIGMTRRDPACPASPAGDARVVVDGRGMLKNALVRIVGAPASDPPPHPVVLTESRCAYQPRVLAMVAGQRLVVHNADATMHNPHARRNRYSTVLNQLQSAGGADVERRFSEANTLLTFDCDYHPTMHASLWIAPNALFAVTDEHGGFAIPGVPSGNWEIEVWHEQFGVKKGRVIVLPDRPAEVHFDYKGSDRAQYPY